MVAAQIPPKGDKKTLLSCRINLEKLQALEKDFPWIHPKKCPACKSTRLWGHGYVLRFFYGFAFGLWMKRYRCPDCHRVHTVKPSQFGYRQSHPRNLIHRSVACKILGKPFLPILTHQLQQFWLKRFFYQNQRHSNWDDPADFFISQVLHDRVGILNGLPVRDIPYCIHAPYLRFAMTAK